MTDRELISVVVPVFKVEKYLDECIQSIFNQTYDYFELILVDDGSPDNCGRMCDWYAKEDSRVKVIHKKNGGLSDARNYGIERASGSYITFIDSDDHISPYYLEILYECMCKSHSDIVQGSHSRNPEDLTEDKEYRQYTFHDSDEILNDYLRFGKLYAYTWNKLYNIRLFKELRYPVGKIQEDSWTTYKAFLNANKVTVIDAVTYRYRYNTESIMKGRFNPKRFDIMGVPDDIQAFLEENGYGKKYQNLLNYYKMRLGMKTYNDCLQSGICNEMAEQMTELRDTLVRIKPDKHIWQNKYIFLHRILRISPQGYVLAVKLIRK